AEDGRRDFHVTGVQTCALPIWVARTSRHRSPARVDEPRCVCGGGHRRGGGPRMTSPRREARIRLEALAGNVETLRRTVAPAQLKIGRAACRERLEFMVGSVQRI